MVETLNGIDVLNRAVACAGYCRLARWVGWGWRPDAWPEGDTDALHMVAASGPTAKQREQAHCATRPRRATLGSSP
jgi:hypothetical protein